MRLIAALVVGAVVLSALKMIVFGLLALALIQLVAYVVKQRTELRIDAQRRARYGIEG